MSASRQRTRSWLLPNLLLLGLVSLFTDAVTEMALPLLPVYLTTMLGAGALALGWPSAGTTSPSVAWPWPPSCSSARCGRPSAAGRLF